MVGYAEPMNEVVESVAIGVERSVIVLKGSPGLRHEFVDPPADLLRAAYDVVGELCPTDLRDRLLTACPY
jgi:hypothetical protein